MLINLSANLLNAGLNYVFIYTLGMGVRGAAIATAISYVVGGTLMFMVYRRKSFLRWSAGSLKFDREIMKESTAIALPALFSNGFLLTILTLGAARQGSASSVGERRRSQNRKETNRDR